MAVDKEFLIKVRADIARAVGDLRRLSGEVEKQGRAAERAARRTEAYGRAMDRLTGYFAAYLSVAGAIQALKLADQWKQQEQRIRTATKATGGFMRVYGELYRLSQENGTAMADTVQTFQRLSIARDALGATNDEIIRVTNAVQQLGILSGASAEAMRNGMLQFSQAMSAGVVRAEEFNSILENMPAVANRIAKGMGMTVGELRKAVLAGDVLSRDVFDALLRQSGEINAEFGDIPDNLTRATNRLVNATGNFLSKLDTALGLTKSIAEYMTTAARALDIAGAVLFTDAESANLDELMHKRAAAMIQYQEELQAQGGDKTHPRVRALRAEIDMLDELIKKRNLAQQQAAQGESGVGGGIKPGPDTELVKPYQRTLEQMQRQLALLGKTSQYERTLWEIQNGRFRDLTADQQKALLHAAREVDAKRAALEASRKAAQAAEEEKAAQEAYNQAQEEAAQRWRELANPMEKVDEQLVQLDTLLQEGRISWETYAEAVFKVTEQMDGVSDKVDESAGEMDQFAIQAARNMQSAFADFLFDPLDKGFKGMVKDFEIAVRRMVSQALASKLAEKLFGDFGKTGQLGGPIGDFFGKIFRFAEGGYVTGPGTATSDSIPARLSAGEYVLNAAAVRRVGVQFLDQLNSSYRPPVWRGPALAFSGGGLVPSVAAGGVNVVINQTIDAPGGRVSPESAQQAATQAGLAVRRALARNA